MNSQLLRPLYDRAARGLPLLGAPTIEESPARSDQAKHEGSGQKHNSEEIGTDETVDRLINRYVAMSSATGFAFGLPGYAAMPVTIPGNVATLLLIQFHLCATIAAMSGRDPQAETVRENAIQCVLDSRELEIFSNDDASDPEASGLADRIASKLSERGVRLLGELATGWLQNAVRRTARSSGILRPRNLPLLGGAFGAINDGSSTRAVGLRAQRAFLASPADEASAE